MKFQTRFKHDRLGRTEPKGETLTRQSEANDVNINTIMRKYRQFGVTPQSVRKGVYADVSNITDYQQSLDKILTANQAFMSLDSEIRKRFANDPQKLLEFLSNDKNREEAISLGFIDKPEKVDHNLEKVSENGSQESPSLSETK